MVYVLNGGAPEKLNIFLNRKDVVLLDNEGDNNNIKNFNDLFNGKLKKDDYILITSENQRYYLDEHKELYNKYKNQIICLKSSNENINLSDKGVITTIKGQEHNQISDTCENLRKVTIQKLIGTDKYIVKPCNGSGSRGIKSSIDLGIFPKTENPIFDKSFKDSDRVVVEPIMNQEDYAIFTMPTVIKNGEILVTVPILSGDYFQGQARWKTIILDTVHFNKTYSIMNNIKNQLLLSDGIFEPELFIKLSDSNTIDFTKWNIIDLNPRWSLDCSTCNHLVDQSFNINNFNLLDIYLNNDFSYLDKFRASKIFDKYLLTDYYLKVTNNNFVYNKFRNFNI